MSLPASLGSAARRDERQARVQRRRTSRACGGSHSGADSTPMHASCVAVLARQLEREEAAHRQPARRPRACRRRGRAGASSASSADAYQSCQRRRRERLRRRRVAGELHAVDGEAAPRELLAEEAHLERRAGEAVHEKDPARARRHLSQGRTRPNHWSLCAPRAYTVSAFPTWRLVDRALDRQGKNVRGNSRLTRVSAPQRWKTGRHASRRFGLSRNRPPIPSRRAWCSSIRPAPSSASATSSPAPRRSPSAAAPTATSRSTATRSRAATPR